MRLPGCWVVKVGCASQATSSSACLRCLLLAQVGLAELRSIAARDSPMSHGPQVLTGIPVRFIPKQIRDMCNCMVDVWRILIWHEWSSSLA
jgi:hypothetical protein